MIEKEFTCVVCPNGCSIKVGYEEGDVYKRQVSRWAIKALFAPFPSPFSESTSDALLSPCRTILAAVP